MGKTEQCMKAFSLVPHCGRHLEMLLFHSSNWPTNQVPVQSSINCWLTSASIKPLVSRAVVLASGNKREYLDSLF